MRRDLHPLVVLTIEALARRFDVAPADLWDWMDRKRPAPRWFVDAAVETFYPGLRDSDFDVDESLTSLHQHNTVGGMAAEPSNVLRSQGRMTEENRAHKAAKALRKHRVTLAEAREAVNADTGGTYAYSTVASWMKAKGDPAARGIPEPAAEVFRKRWGVPLSAWARVIPKA